jgi:hypothetical protein
MVPVFMRSAGILINITTRLNIPIAALYARAVAVALAQMYLCSEQIQVAEQAVYPYQCNTAYSNNSQQCAGSGNTTRVYSITTVPH